MSRVAKDEDSVVPTSAGSLLSAPRPDELLSLAHAACSGDPDAINTLIMSVGGGMLKTVRKVLGPGHPDVEDVTQDAVLALLSSLRAFRGECTVAHFAHRVALLTALAARRRLRTRDRWTEADTAPESIADERGPSPLTRAMASRRRAIVRALFDELSEPMAEALALHFVLGYTVEEIATTAEVPANTVWSRLRLGKQALRKKLLRDSRIIELLRSRARASALRLGTRGRAHARGRHVAGAPRASARPRPALTTRHARPPSRPNKARSVRALASRRAPAP